VCSSDLYVNGHFVPTGEKPLTESQIWGLKLHIDPTNGGAGRWQPEISLRDYFAWQAANGLMYSGWMQNEKLAERAYAIADAMIVEREKVK
jgi:hypothetical protein